VYIDAGFIVLRLTKLIFRLKSFANLKKKHTKTCG